MIVTVRISRASSLILTRISVLWVICRVPPSRPVFDKCYRCYGFGHQSKDCSGTDLSKACNQCGVLWHEGKDCPMVNNCQWCCINLVYINISHEIVWLNHMILWLYDQLPITLDPGYAILPNAVDVVPMRNNYISLNSNIT